MINNTIFNSYKILSHLNKGEFPIHVQIDPTLYCNQNCIWCHFRTGVNFNDPDRKKGKLEHLPFKLFDKLIDDCKKLKVEAITFGGGGEPLIYPNFDNILKKINKLGIKFGVISNGARVLEGELLKELSKAQFIRFSIDAFFQDTYEKLHRTKFKVDDVFDNIEKLKKLNPDIIIGTSFLTCKYNYNEIMMFALNSATCGADYVQYRPVAYKKNLENGMLKYIDEITKKLNFAKESYDDDKFKVFLQEHRYEYAITKKRDYDICRAINYTLSIGADAKVYPCCAWKYTKRYAYGDLKKESLKDIWKKRYKTFSVKDCPHCWLDEANKILDYIITEPKIHKEFI